MSMPELSSSDVIRRYYLFSGWVQGVGFRFEASNQAKRLGLVGWVRNRMDGDVEAELEGSPAQLDAFLEGMRSVLRFRITDIQERELPPQRNETAFRVVY